MAFKKMTQMLLRYTDALLAGSSDVEKKDEKEEYSLDYLNNTQFVIK